MQSRKALGESQTDVARELGKSQAYITYAMAMIDAPDWLMTVYREGKCRGMAELYHLRRLHEQAPQRVQQWIDQQPSISRTDIQRLKRLLEADSQEATVTATTATVATSAINDARPDAAAVAGAHVVTQPLRSAPLQQGLDIAAPAAIGQSAATKAARETSASGDTTSLLASVLLPLRTHRLLAKLNSQVVEIILDTVPSASGRVFVRERESDNKIEVTACDLVLVGFEATGAT